MSIINEKRDSHASIQSIKTKKLLSGSASFLNPRVLTVIVAVLLVGIMVVKFSLASSTQAGLTAQYFNNQTLSGTPVVTRVDPQVNYNWGTASPAPGVPSTNFSVRWTGNLTPAQSGVYQIFTASDDGVRVWINNQLVVNSWTNHGSMENSGSISLTAGTAYPVKVEYYQNQGQALASLQWANNRAGITQTVIPQSLLTTAVASPTPSPSATPTISATPVPTPTPTPTPTATPVSSACTNTAHPSVTSFATLSFCDDFPGTSLNTSKWNPYMTSRAANGYPWNANKLPSGDSAPNAGGYSAAYYSPSKISVNNGVLGLSLAPSTAVSGYTYMSSSITTYNHFQFKGGYVQVTAKLPNDLSQGGWPSIWFLPGPGGTGGDRGEIDLNEGGFVNTDAGLSSTVPQNQVMVSHYLGPNSSWVAAGYNTGVDMTAGYHTFGMEYKPGVSIKTYFDGHLVGNWSNDINTDPYEIIINQQVATSSAKGWHSIGNPPAPSTYSISSVKVWQ